MKRVAVFLDAGYFWVQLCNVLLGTYSARTEVIVDYDELRKLMLAEVSRQFGADCHFLRVYWYDGPGTSGKTREHNAIDRLDDFKLRLGTRNGVGSQKGVDGLIIADLISLTQQRAITHAMLITGDADITPGVIAAQGMGLRVHLLSLGSVNATSPYLAAEADLKRSWGAAEAAIFAKASTTCAVKTLPPEATPSGGVPATGAPASGPVALSEATGRTSPPNRQTKLLGKAELQEIARKAKQQSQVEPQAARLPALPSPDVKILPREIDIFLLNLARKEIGRSLEETEKRILRDEFRRLL